MVQFESQQSPICDTLGFSLHVTPTGTNTFLTCFDPNEMNKLRLEDLNVESFATDSSSPESGGTVRGQVLSVDEACIATLQATCAPCQNLTDRCGTAYTNCGCDYTEDFADCNTINGYYGCTGDSPCLG